MKSTENSALNAYHVLKHGASGEDIDLPHRGGMLRGRRMLMAARSRRLGVPNKY